MTWKNHLRTLEAQKLWDQAIAFMEQVVKDNPDDVDAYIYIIFLYLEIKKIQEVSGDYYYSVMSPDYPHVPMFYIGINPTEKRIRLYKDLADKQFECEILVDQYEINQLPAWIPGFLIYATLKKVRQAIEDNQFSDYISFQS